MSLKSDEFEEINYSALSGNKNEKSEEIQFNNEINNDNNNKKCLHKSLSLSGINYNKVKAIILTYLFYLDIHFLVNLPLFDNNTFHPQFLDLNN